MKLHRHPSAAKELAPDFIGHASLACTWWSLKDDKAARLQEFKHLGGSRLYEELLPQLTMKLFVFDSRGLHDLPAALVGVQVEKRTDDIAGDGQVGCYARANVKLGTVTLEDFLEAWKPLPSGLWHLHT